MQGRLFVVYLTYGSEHFVSGRKELDALVRRVLPNVQRVDVTVDNAHEDSLVWEMEERNWVISGDNSNREFSGWDAGLRFLVNRYSIEDEDFILLANDTFHRNHGRDYLDRFSRRGVRLAIRRGGILGYTDAYPEPVSVLGLTVQRWVRTSIFFAQARTIWRLMPLSPLWLAGGLFSEDETFFADKAPLSPNYRAYMKTWLFSDATSDNFKERWHSHTALTAENLRFLQGKAQCIISEHFLSARAQSLGIPILDIRNYDRHWLRGLPGLRIA